ncbi:hypothetical protein [Neodiprion abietis nucleopolyhedrovirus]|uniref:F-box domain-containing protein n=1 Tax=Neodiprion abietis nucleopolyhedrovirus TaxID=204507 RepID=Q0ZP51_9CBAC|nr:hypothetical protein [Neodiprion abietis nucleopolyhedrovirus]ABC74903.1 unknown [Neodiprion abietis nucleopolyhedrovirus]
MIMCNIYEYLNTIVCEKPKRPKPTNFERPKPTLNLDDMPELIVCNICEYLYTTDCQSLRLVNKHLSNVVKLKRTKPSQLIISDKNLMLRYIQHESSFKYIRSLYITEHKANRDKQSIANYRDFATNARFKFVSVFPQYKYSPYERQQELSNDAYRLYRKQLVFTSLTYLNIHVNLKSKQRFRSANLVSHALFLKRLDLRFTGTNKHGIYIDQEEFYLRYLNEINLYFVNGKFDLFLNVLNLRSMSIGCRNASMNRVHLDCVTLKTLYLLSNEADVFTGFIPQYEFCTSFKMKKFDDKDLVDVRDVPNKLCRFFSNRSKLRNLPETLKNFKYKAYDDMFSQKIYIVYV